MMKHKANERWETVEVPTHPIKGGRWVKVIEEIRCNATGEIRKCEDQSPLYESEGDTEPRPFIWEEGNYSCDCNRRLFFLRAIGEEEPEAGDGPPCGHGAYSVRLSNAATGRVFYDEFEERPDSTTQSEW